MALIDSQVAYWKLEEASGTREDSHGANDLTDNNTVGQAAGIIGNAASFIQANSEYLSIADNTDMSTGDISFFFSAWVYLSELTSTKIIVGKMDGVLDEYRLYYFASDTFYFEVFGITTSLAVGSTTFGAPSANTWYNVVGKHDAAANLIGIAVNAGTEDTSSYSAGVNNGVGTFGISDASAGGQYWAGRIDEVGFWKRAVTAQDRTDLYNGGAGNQYPYGAVAASMVPSGFGYSPLQLWLEEGVLEE